MGCAHFCRYSYFEGGVRASSFLASPLLPPAVIGTTNNALLHVADWWPTFAGLAGLNTTDDCGGKHPNGCPSVDGRDAWAIITGETGDQSVSANARTHADRVPWRTELLLGIGGPKQQGACVNKCGTLSLPLSFPCTLLSALVLRFALEGTSMRHLSTSQLGVTLQQQTGGVPNTLAIPHSRHLDLTARHRPVVE